MGEGDVVNPRGGSRAWLGGALASFVVAAAFVGSLLATYLYRVFAAKPEAPPTVSTLRGTSSVLTAVRDLAILESTSYHMERVIDLRDRQAHLFGLFESEDALLLVAAADVVAGVDLASMGDGDISFDRQNARARVILPPPRVLSTRLDNAHTYVHSRRTDRLAVRAESLETRARLEAERALEDAAVEAGILERARSNAARTVRSLVESLGYDHVEVTFRAE